MSVDAVQPELTISLEGVRVDFPAGWWDDPANDLIGRTGRRILDERIDVLALSIAAGLRKLLRERRPPSGLVDPRGCPIVAGEELQRGDPVVVTADGRALVATPSRPSADTVG